MCAVVEYASLLVAGCLLCVVCCLSFVVCGLLLIVDWCC